MRDESDELNARLHRIGKHLVSLVHSGEYSTLEVAELFGVGRSTVYRAIERQRTAAKANLPESRPRR
ncbi:helix-turn-helix domain-containing protein [Nocardioides glacieisoli]|uniref:helix-turn-helix domain-containing protein n=1 Tax=Nocardioides glacieisoli TaxID=1168730 RepID=UPI001A939416|nr:helix-turn-helix domain-containing protein [Nocardioides glacieisoli]